MNLKKKHVGCWDIYPQKTYGAETAKHGKITLINHAWLYFSKHRRTLI